MAPWLTTCAINVLLLKPASEFQLVSIAKSGITVVWEMVLLDRSRSVNVNAGSTIT